MIPGEMFIKDGEIVLNEGRRTVTLTVANSGDRPIQVGSHYHFFETNPALKFDRKKARGMRLNIAAGTAVRFEPGPDARGDTGGARRQTDRLRLPWRRDGQTLTSHVAQKTIRASNTEARVMGVGVLAVGIFVPATVIAVVAACWLALDAVRAGSSWTAISCFASLVMIASPLVLAAFATRPQPDDDNPIFLIQYGVFRRHCWRRSHWRSHSCCEDAMCCSWCRRCC